MTGDSVFRNGSQLFPGSRIDNAQIAALLVGNEQRRMRGWYLAEGGNADKGDQKER